MILEPHANNNLRFSCSTNKKTTVQPIWGTNEPPKGRTDERTNDWMKEWKKERTSPAPNEQKRINGRPPVESPIESANKPTNDPANERTTNRPTTYTKDHPNYWVTEWLSNWVTKRQSEGQSWQQIGQVNFSFKRVSGWQASGAYRSQSPSWSGSKSSQVWGQATEPFWCVWHCSRIMSAPHLNSETRCCTGLSQKKICRHD